MRPGSGDGWGREGADRKDGSWDGWAGYAGKDRGGERGAAGEAGVSRDRDQGDCAGGGGAVRVDLSLFSRREGAARGRGDPEVGGWVRGADRGRVRAGTRSGDGGG